MPTPLGVEQLTALGYDVVIKSEAGALSAFADESYLEARARIGTGEAAWGAGIVFRVNGPSPGEVAKPQDGATLVSIPSPALGTAVGMTSGVAGR
ncbi:hypothetical protein ACFXA3_27710 [Streptomyces sp. NPDC059456]|uniref:hypothetical protein n=1 Tax=Streptomyces sp. NPDC059456 TaxID=3346838 RepID=UPI0036C9881A